MRLMRGWIALSVIVFLTAAQTVAARPPALPEGSHGAPLVCSHQRDILRSVHGKGSRLVAHELTGRLIPALFAAMAVALPARFAHADAALLLHEAGGRGAALVLLFRGGCALAALRLPAAAALGALTDVIGQEV